MDGPSGNGPGSGDAVGGTINNYTPWATAPLPPCNVAAIPTLSQAMQLVLMALIALIGIAAMRRNTRAEQTIAE